MRLLLLPLLVVGLITATACEGGEGEGEGGPCEINADCDDGLFCNGEERCLLDSTCGPGFAPEGPVDGGSACLEFFCDETLDQVREQPVANGTSCANFQLCLPDAVCQEGLCTGEVNRDLDNNTCTIDSCDGRGLFLVDPQDFNSCTVDSCSVDGAVINEPNDELCLDTQVCARGFGVGCVTSYVNDTDSDLEVDFCNIQFPTTPSTLVVNSSLDFFGQVFQTGLTNTTNGSAAAGVRSQFGFAPDSATSIQDFVFTDAAFNGERGDNNNNDEYKGVFSAATVGSFRVAFRVSLDGGRHWTACDIGGAGANDGLEFSIENTGLVTVIQAAD